MKLSDEVPKLRSPEPQPNTFTTELISIDVLLALQIHNHTAIKLGSALQVLSIYSIKHLLLPLALVGELTGDELLLLDELLLDMSLGADFSAIDH